MLHGMQKRGANYRCDLTAIFQFVPPGFSHIFVFVFFSFFQTVFPMQRARSHHPGLSMDRIYTRCHTLSATGRVSLHEPNIQNIPRLQNF